MPHATRCTSQYVNVKYLDCYVEAIDMSDSRGEDCVQDSSDEAAALSDTSVELCLRMSDLHTARYPHLTAHVLLI